MALALLWAPEAADEDQAAFRLRFDVGGNRYYAWQLGDEERVVAHGIPRLANVTERSPLLGPLEESARGRGVLEIPRSQISKAHRFAQLWSFRDAERNGPAVSPIVELGWWDARPDVGDRPELDALPPPALFAPRAEASAWIDARGGSAMSVALSRSPRALPVDAVPMRWRERELSSGMFLQGLLSALPSLLPSVAPIIGKLVGSIFPSQPTPPGGTASNPQLASAIEQLLRTIGAQAAPGGPAAVPAAAPAAAHSLSAGALGKRVERCVPRSYARSRAASARRRRGTSSAPLVQAQGYSEAMIAPALVAALPALMPLLQQVLSPQNVQTLVEAPQKMTGQVINGLIDFAKIGGQMHEAERQHLRELNPGVDNPALNQLLMSMGQGLSATQRLNYRRSTGVKLAFDAAQSQVLYGRSRVLYRRDRALQFPMSVSTPRTIAKARLVLQVKHPDTLDVLIEDSADVGELSTGPIPLIPRIEADQVAKLEPNRDYVVAATLIWRNKKRQQIGTSLQQRITVVGEYCFDRVEESGEPLPASDFERYRDLWHKVWETEFGAEGRVARIHCRYYLVLNPKRTNNARLDTLVETKNGDLGGTLKVGMEYSPHALNHLLTRLAPGETQLGDAELEALGGEDFVERFNQGAQFSGKLRGRRGERGALWVYPEFKIQTLVLTRADDVDEHGNVRALNETRVRFPMPVMVHFVGVKSA